MQTFLVLVPHRDIRVKLRKYCELIIKTGITGVYNFPYIAPLASLSQALSTSELKQTAHTLREATGNNKIFTEEINVTAFPNNEKDLTLIGPKLNINIPQNVFDSGAEKIDTLFSTIIVGCFLIPELIHNPNEDNKKLKLLRDTPFESLGFRAAAAANMRWMSFKVNGEIYYKWEIGKLCWLPRPEKVSQKVKNMYNKPYEGQKPS
jgi:hypothetical protein